MTKEEVLETLQRRAIEADLVQATGPVGEVYRAAHVLVQGLSDGLTLVQADGDTLWTVAQLMTHMQVSKDYVYSHHKGWPFARKVGGNCGSLSRATNSGSTARRRKLCYGPLT